MKRNIKNIPEVAMLGMILIVATSGLAQDIGSQWKFGYQRKEIEPLPKIDTKNTFEGKPTLLIEGNGKEHADGHWYKTVSVEPASYFQFHSYFQASNVVEPPRSILVPRSFFFPSGADTLNLPWPGRLKTRSTLLHPPTI